MVLTTKSILPENFSFRDTGFSACGGEYRCQGDENEWKYFEQLCALGPLKKKGRYCVPNPDAHPEVIPKFCPSEVTKAGAPTGLRYSNPNIQCEYPDFLDLSKGFLVNGKFSDSTGNKYFDPINWESAKLNYCTAGTNIDNQECKQYFTDSGQSWPLVKLGLCAGKDDWTTDKTCVTTVNEVFRNGKPAEKDKATLMVEAVCSADPKDKKVCSCYYAANRTVDQCLTSNTIPGCDNIADKVEKLESLGADFFSAELTPFCAADPCKQALGGSSDYLLIPGGTSIDCSQNINACFNKVTAGNISDAGSLDDSCHITVSKGPEPSPTPKPPTPSGPSPTPKPPTPSGPSPTPKPPTPKPPTPPEDDNTGLIIGLSVGGFILFLFCIFLIIKIKMSR